MSFEVDLTMPKATFYQQNPRYQKKLLIVTNAWPTHVSSATVFASMATTPTRKTRFSRRVPDHVTDELVNVLSSSETYEFNSLFKLVYDNLKLKNAVSGGEEMLRLRSYEKLQGLVSRGLCAKAGKTYRGLEGLRAAHQATIAARTAAVAAR